MNGEVEWLRITKPRARIQAEPDSSRKALPTANERTAQGLAARTLNRVGEVARRAGNQVAQRYAQEGAFVAPENVERAINAEAGGGTPLDHATKGQMEGAFDSDLSSVRIHNDSRADALNTDLSARAFTRGNDIFFASGEYAPGTGTGQRLLAHELTHVEQQQDGAKLDVGASSDPAELEADAVANEVVRRISGEASQTSLGSEGVQRQEEEEEEEAIQTVRRQGMEEEEEEVQA